LFARQSSSPGIAKGARKDGSHDRKDRCLMAAPLYVVDTSA
jgi:hypothetical protein